MGEQGDLSQDPAGKYTHIHSHLHTLQCGQAHLRLASSSVGRRVSLAVCSTHRCLFYRASSHVLARFIFLESYFHRVAAAQHPPGLLIAWRRKSKLFLSVSEEPSSPAPLHYPSLPVPALAPDSSSPILSWGPEERGVTTRQGLMRCGIGRGQG